MSLTLPMSGDKMALYADFIYLLESFGWIFITPLKAKTPNSTIVWWIELLYQQGAISNHLVRSRQSLFYLTLCISIQKNNRPIKSKLVLFSRTRISCVYQKDGVWDIQGGENTHDRYIVVIQSTYIRVYTRVWQNIYWEFESKA